MAQGKWATVRTSAAFPWKSFLVIVLLATTAVACWAAFEMREQRDHARSQVEGLMMERGKR